VCTVEVEEVWVEARMYVGMVSQEIKGSAELCETRPSVESQEEEERKEIDEERTLIKEVFAVDVCPQNRGAVKILKAETHLCGQGQLSVSRKRRRSIEEHT